MHCDHFAYGWSPDDHLYWLYCFTCQNSRWFLTWDELLDWKDRHAVRA